MASRMYDYLFGMYMRGTLTDAALDAAVTKGWVTADEAAQIRAAKNPPTTTNEVETVG